MPRARSVAPTTAVRSSRSEASDVTRPISGRLAPEQRRPADRPVPEPAIGTEPGTARIAVDLLGGDHAPAVVVDGALRACQADPALQLLLVGPLEAAGELLAALGPADRARVRTLAAPAERADLLRVAPASEQARAAARTDQTPGKDRQADSWVESGVRAAVLAVAQNEADAVVS